MTYLSDLSLVTDVLPDSRALYDRFGNRYVFNSHREYQVARQLQIIAWITRNRPLHFL